MKALVLLPTCHSALAGTGAREGRRRQAMAGLVPGKVTRSETAEMCSALRRVVR